MTRPLSIDFTLCREGEEFDVTIEVGSYSRAVRGRTSGPPEDCYEPEPAEVEIGRVTRDGKVWDVEFDGDEEDRIRELLLEACAEEDEARSDAAADARYDAMRAGDFDR